MALNFGLWTENLVSKIQASTVQLVEEGQAHVDAESYFDSEVLNENK